MSAHFETFEREDGAIGFRVVDGNNEIIAASEGYDSVYNCERGIANLIDTVKQISAFKVAIKHT